jgi:hypothetical protein
MRLPGSSESVVGVGPGTFYRGGRTLFQVNVYTEVEANNRCRQPDGGARATQSLILSLIRAR